MIDVIVVGAGISGLTAAHRLLRAGADVRVVDSAPHAGGLIRSERVEGFLCEHGAEATYLQAPQVATLAAELGLELVPTKPAARLRHVYRGGRLCPLPPSPLGFLKSPVLSARGKLRMFLEPVFGRRPRPEATAAEFFRQALGPEAADHLVDVAVGGIFAGRADALELAAAFPRIHALALRHRSLLVGLARGGPGFGRKLGAPADGMGAFVTAIAQRLDERLELGHEVSALRRLDRGLWEVVVAGEPVRARSVLLCTPAASLATLLGPLVFEARALAAQPKAPVALVFHGYRADETPELVQRSFGFLVDPAEGLPLLGTVFPSSVHEGRAPDGTVLVRSILGGARRPDAVALDDAQLLAQTRAALAQVLGLRAEPLFTRVVRVRGGIPQYPPGTTALKHTLERALAALPGLHVGGSALYGVSVADCIASGEDLAALVQSPKG